MSDLQMPLLIHGEVTDPSGDVFEREQVFIDSVLKPLREAHPRLRIVLEHITTSYAVEYIRSCSSDSIAATITVHHLLYSYNNMFCGGGINPHMYCLPILKSEENRKALLRAATSGDPHFFIGTDSAPHSINHKESGCGRAGIFTAHAAVELYAELFESVGALDKLEGFCSVFGAQFYRLPMSEKKVQLVREDWVVPDTYTFGRGLVKPCKAGETVHWKIVGKTY